MMKNLIPFLLMSSLLVMSFSAKAQVNLSNPFSSVSIGSEIHIAMKEKLTTKKSEQGETFEAELASDLYHRDQLIAKKGAPIQGKVLHLQEGQQKPQEIRAEMELTLTHLRVDGEWIPIETKPLLLRTERNFTALKVGSATAVGAGILGFRGAAAGSLVGLGWAVITKDKQIKVKRKAELIFKLRRPGRLKRAARNTRL